MRFLRSLGWIWLSLGLSAFSAKAAEREFRGAWVATVYNLDWPSGPGLPAATQKAQLRTLLDRAAELNLNAILLQVRPASDALYASTKEPWSEFLSGKAGVSPGYDPLEFAVAEAHAQAPGRTRDNAEFFQVHFHDVGNYLRLPLSETAPEERGDLRIPICVLKIRCAATGPVRTAIGNDTPWCNGNTAPFGGVIHGSNPCGVVNRT